MYLHRPANLLINGSILKVQVEKFATLMYYAEFNCNNGALVDLKNKNNIVYAKVRGEVLSVDENIVSDCPNMYGLCNTSYGRQSKIDDFLQYEKQVLCVLLCTLLGSTNYGSNARIFAAPWNSL